MGWLGGAACLLLAITGKGALFYSLSFLYVFDPRSLLIKEQAREVFGTKYKIINFLGHALAVRTRLGGEVSIRAAVGQ